MTQDTTAEVTVKTYENIYDYSIVNVVNFKNPRIKVYVNADNLEKIVASSGSKLNFTSVWTADDLNIEMSSGSFGSPFRGLVISALDGSVRLSSGSYAEVNASETLYAEGSEASLIRYKGTPEITVKTSSGATIIRLP